MRNVMLIGIVLLVIGAGLMIVGTIPRREKHEADVFGAKLSVTTHEERRIPYAASGTILGVGAALTVIGALKRRR